MVKLNTICRSENDYTRETKFDITKVQRSNKPELHQFQQAREYQRALTSAKMDKIFAKPFLGCLTGHSDTPTVFSKCPNNLVKVLSGSFNGELRAWDVVDRKTLFSMNCHKNALKGVSFSYDGSRFLTSGDDKIINLWDFQDCLNKRSEEPKNRYMSKYILGNVDHCWKENQFVTSGQVVQVWDYQRSKPISKLEWGGMDSVIKVKYNLSEVNLLACTGIDRSVMICDTRGETPIQKIQLQNKCQAVCWNPTEPINLTVGCDDGNAYTFDMRKMESIKFIHKDHTRAIMDLDIAPTGKQFVTGSYDQTVRIFDINGGKSKEVYHGKRMQSVFSVAWTLDNEYILSGSDDMNIRIWKTKAAKPIGIINNRHENSLNYRDALKSKFKYVPEIKRINRHRHLPKYITNANNRKQEQKESKFRKSKNREINNPNQWTKPKPERDTKILNIEN